MKTQYLKFDRWAPGALLSAALLAFTSRSTTDGTEELDLIETPDGAIIVDARKRKVFLQLPHGSTKQVNLAAVPLGTDVTVRLSDGLAISVVKQN